LYILPSDPQNKLHRNWLIKTIASSCLVILLVVAANMEIDIYGIFRSVHGRHLSVYGDERISKYLLSEKYVPLNFNALLVGSSVSANWNLGNIQSFRTYNESLNGGNIVEEKAIVDQALSRPGIKVAILIVHPFLTNSHTFETVQLTPKENIAALGSQSLLDAYKDKATSLRHHGKWEFDEFGTDDFHAPNKLNPTLQKMMTPGTDFATDDVVATLHAKHIRILYVIPPLSRSLLATKHEAVDRYSALILGGKSSEDEVIDFTSNEFADFRNDDNFADGVHSTKQASLRIVEMIDQKLKAWATQPD
jgi:hypothetical protein